MNLIFFKNIVVFVGKVTSLGWDSGGVVMVGMVVVDGWLGCMGS